MHSGIPPATTREWKLGGDTRPRGRTRERQLRCPSWILCVVLLAAILCQRAQPTHAPLASRPRLRLWHVGAKQQDDLGDSHFGAVCQVACEPLESCLAPHP